MNNIKRQKNKRVRLQVLKLRAFAALLLVVTALSVTYVGLIGMSVKSVVERKDAEARGGVLRAEIAQMENEYLTRVGDITLARAQGAGLTTVASKGFTERRVLVGQAN